MGIVVLVLVVAAFGPYPSCETAERECADSHEGEPIAKGGVLTGRRAVERTARALPWVGHGYIGVRASTVVVNRKLTVRWKCKMRC